MTGGSHTLRVPIEEALDAERRTCRSTWWARRRGCATTASPTKLAAAAGVRRRGTIDLTVPPLARTLALAVTPREKELEPGGKTMVDVVAQGRGRSRSRAARSRWWSWTRRCWR